MAEDRRSQTANRAPADRSVMADDPTVPLPYICMPGSPYAGSTLLGFLLDAHPACASIGAATGLTRRVDLKTYTCSCGRAFLRCPFWANVAERTIELGHPVSVYQTGFWNTHVRLSRRRWLNGVLVRSLGPAVATSVRDATIGNLPPIRRRLSEARAATWALSRAVLEESGKQAFVDTSRDHQRPKYLVPAPSLELKAIHLIRDPRGNTASIMRHTGVDVVRAARQWRHYNLEADRSSRRLPSGSWLRVHYEDLCRDPQATLDEIARFIGVEAAPMPPLDTAEHHIIGNSMRLRSIEAIREDQGWREALTQDDLAVIERITGDVSRRLGYPRPPTSTGRAVPSA